MRNRGILLALAVAALAIVGVVAAQADQPSDAMTTLKVKMKLLQELGGEALEIDVDTIDGHVHLTGDVEERASLELADDLAKSVDGVLSVDNALTLESPPPATVEGAAGEIEREVGDAMLEGRVRLALIDELGMTGLQIGTEAADGQVVLEFDADISKSARERAVAAVEKVEGVRKVSSVDERG